MGKLFVFDLDGTLLRDDKTISESTTNVLIDLVKKNNSIMFATARAPRDIYEYIPYALRNSPIICYNGACIVKEGKIIYKRELLRECILEVIKLAKQYNYNEICLEINDKLYSNFNPVDFFGNVSTQITNLTDLNFQTAYKIIVCSKKIINYNFKEELPTQCKGIITDKGTLCQIMNKEASKWNSIEFLRKELSINNMDIIAFGDDYNDIDMIKNAGIGIAMGNAETAVKDVADFIIDTNMNDGVAKYIVNTFL